LQPAAEVGDALADGIELDHGVSFAACGIVANGREF